MRLARVSVRGRPSGPFDLDLPAGVPSTVLVAEHGPSAQRLVDLVVAAKERVGPYGVVGTPPWPAARGPAEVTLAVSLDPEERDFAAVEEEVVETTCKLHVPATAAAVERHPPGLSALFLRHGADASLGRFERIPAHRSLEGGPPGGTLPAVRKLLYLSTHPKKLAGLPQILVDAARDRSSVSERFQAALARVGAAVTFAGSKVIDGRHELVFQRKGRLEPLFDLGLDEQQLVLFAGFFSALPASRSVLLIEEPELHLGPAAARALLAGVIALAEGNQLLVTTRSGELARAVQGAHVVSLTEIV